MTTTISRNAAVTLAAGLLILASAGRATAATAERIYSAPFEGAETYVSLCEPPGCEGHASATEEGSVSAELEVLGGPGVQEHGYGALFLSHTLTEPADEVSFELRLRVEHGHAKALGVLTAHAEATVTLEAWHLRCSACFAFKTTEIAAADAPYGQVHREGMNITVRATAGSGPRVVPAGELDVSVLMQALVSTVPPHELGEGPCASGCLGAGRAAAQIEAVAESLKVVEHR